MKGSSAGDNSLFSNFLTELIVLFDDAMTCIGVVPISTENPCELFWKRNIGKCLTEILHNHQLDEVKAAMLEAQKEGSSGIIFIDTFHDGNNCHSKGEFRKLENILQGSKTTAWYQHSTYLSQEADYQIELDSFKRLVEGMEVPMFIIDPIDQRIITANHNAIHLTKIPSNDISGKRIPEVSNLQSDKVTTLIDSILSGKIKKIPYYFINSDGSKTTLEIQATPIHLHGKTIIVGIVFDLTERIENEEKLKRNLLLFQLLIEENTLPIVLIDSESLNIVSANHRASSFLGVSGENLKGLPFANFSNIPQKRFNSIIKDFMEKKYTGLELPLKTQNQQTRDVAIHYTISEINNRKHYLVILIDITERNQALAAVARAKENLSSEVCRQTADLVKMNSTLHEQIKEREKVEQKLRHSEQIFLKLFQIDPNGMILKLAKTGAVTEVNNSFQRIFNLKKGNVLLKKTETLPIHCDTERYFAAYQELLKARSVNNVPLTMLCSRGHARFILYSGELIAHEKGDYVLEIFQDITNIHITQQKLAESEENYRSMFNNALVGFYRTEIETGVVINANDQYAKILGYRKSEDIIGRSLILHYLDEEDRDRFISILKREKTAVYENAILTKNKKTTWVVNFARIYPEKGYMEGVVVDITDRKMMEDMLAFSETRFRSMIENASDVIIIVDRQGNGLYFSPSITKQLGYNIKEGYKTNILEFFDSKERTTIRRILSSKIIRKKINEIKVRHKNGSYRVYEFTATNLIDNPSVGGIIINARDITHQIKARKEIDLALKREQELSRQKTQFISTVSHEFRTPITNISLNIQLLQKHLGTGKIENANESLSRMGNAIKRLTALLNEVSLISKDQSGRLQYSPETISIHQLVEELIDQQSYLFLPYVEVSISTDEGINVLADKTLLSHILGNLVSNAVKYSPGKGSVLVKIELKANLLEIIVKDQGIGIPNSEIDYLFSPYFRASNVKNIQGTGLGLSIVKKCVELHNGTISIQSKLGKGTEVICKIPLTN